MRNRVSEHLGQCELSVENNLFSDCQGLVVAKNEMTPQNLFTSKLSGTLTAAKVSSLLNSSSQLLPRPNKCGLGLQSDTLVKDGAAFALELCWQIVIRLSTQFLLCSLSKATLCYIEWKLKIRCNIFLFSGNLPKTRSCRRKKTIMIFRRKMSHILHSARLACCFINIPLSHECG